jgi:osmotically-inducible protein OsmY
VDLGMLRSSQYITVVVENGRVTVAGRVYESGHVMLIPLGASG